MTEREGTLYLMIAILTLFVMLHSYKGGYGDGFQRMDYLCHARSEDQS